MPSFEIEVDFEAYCDACSAGICHNIETGKTNGRKHDYIKIVPCENCIKAAKNEAEAEYQDRITELESELESLKEGDE